MEETAGTPRHMPPQQEVSFPQPKEPNGRGKGLKVLVAIIGVVVIVLVGGWLILGNSSGGSASPSPTPVGGLSTFPTPEVAETPESTPTPKPVEKGKVRIEVLNGTGVPGEASFLQGKLEDAGFEEVTAGNADNQDETETVATYSRDLPPEITDEMTQLLEGLYKKVRTRKATISGDFDVSITTGPRAGSATATPKASASPASTSPDTTPTSSPTASPAGE